MTMAQTVRHEANGLHRPVLRSRPARGASICGRCWRFIPTPYKLALWEHHEILKTPSSDLKAWFIEGAVEWSRAETRAFVAWSAREAETAAAEEATRQRLGWSHPDDLDL